MSRTTAICLAIGLAIVSAIAICFGYIEMEKRDVKSAAPKVEITCKEVLAGKAIEPGVPLFLTDFQHGKHIVGYDNNGDGIRETVYVPLFPRDTKKLGPSYSSVIAHFANLKDEQELKDIFAGEKLELRYDAEIQALDPATYSRMARKYPSMNFGENVLLTSKPGLDIDMAMILILGGGIGGVVALALAGFCMFAAMLDFLKSRIAKDNEKFTSVDVKANRAGLPQ